MEFIIYAIFVINSIFDKLKYQQLGKKPSNETTLNRDNNLSACISVELVTKILVDYIQKSETNCFNSIELHWGINCTLESLSSFFSTKLQSSLPLKIYFLANVLRKAPCFQTWPDNALKDLTVLTKPRERKLQNNCHLALTVKCLCINFCLSIINLLPSVYTRHRSSATI